MLLCRASTNLSGYRRIRHVPFQIRDLDIDRRCFLSTGIRNTFSLDVVHARQLGSGEDQPDLAHPIRR